MTTKYKVVSWMESETTTKKGISEKLRKSE